MAAVSRICLKTCLLLFLVVFALALPSRFKLLTYGFKMEKLQLSLPPSSAWEVEPSLSQEEMEQIFAQPFFFLGKGAQAYVFASHDQQFVLKLFRFDHRSNMLFDREKWDARQKKQAVSLFTSCLLGWQRAQEETALLYLHLNPTVDLLPTLIATAPLGRTLHLPLDHIRFALQRRVVPLAIAFEKALKDGTLHAKVEALTHLLERRTEKKIGNRDPNLWRNFGFLGDRAVEIDFGNYVERSDFVSDRARKEEVERYLSQLRKWLAKHPMRQETSKNTAPLSSERF